MKTNELIYKEISGSGVITEANMKLLKNRSNKSGRDLFDYDFLESFSDGCGIPLTVEQGEKGLLWLKNSFARMVVQTFTAIEKLI